MTTSSANDDAALAAGCWVDDEAGARVVRFVETFVRPKGGRQAGQKFKLFGWQRQLLTRLFSWRRPDGTRRFRQGYISLARQNGKTFLCAAIVLYMMMADGEDAPACASAATCRKQAGIIFDYLRHSIEANPELKAATHLVPSQKKILVPTTGGSFDSLSCEGRSNLGPSYNCIILDELSFHPSDRLASALEPATAARQQPLTLAITTAGMDFDSPGFQWYTYAKKIDRGEVIDPSFFSSIHEAEEGCCVLEESQWTKANPSIHDGLLDLEELRRAALQASVSKAKELAFRYFRLNNFTTGISTYYSLEKWDHCKGAYPDLAGQSIYLGMDAAKSKSLCAVAGLVPYAGRYYVVHHAWIPRAAVDQAAAAAQDKYEMAIREGTLTVVPGNGSDTTLMRDYVVQLSQRFKVAQILYDPNYMHETAAELERRRFKLQRFAQTSSNYSEPIKLLENYIADRKIVHDGSELLRWQISSTAVEAGKDERLMVSKGKSSSHVDSVVCLLMSLAYAVQHEAKKVESVYERRGLLSV